MRRIPLVLLMLAATIVGGLSIRARSRSGFPAEAVAPGGLLILEGSEKHLVTPEMATASQAMIKRSAPDFSKPGTDGATHQLKEMLRRGPVLLTFIKKGCPCSEAAQSFFNELHAAYPGVSMRGVIDVDLEPAKRWTERFHVEYPLLIDPEADLVRGYGAENSAYVVFVDSEGEIAKHWPGYSESMLQELGSLLAVTTGSEEKPLNFADAPSELYTGCPYELDR